MDKGEAKLSASSCPRFVATSKTFDFPTFLSEFDMPVDVVWCCGDLTPFDDRPSSCGGFAVFLAQYASQLWEQEADLQLICCKHNIALSTLRGDDVNLRRSCFRTLWQGRRHWTSPPFCSGCLPD